MTSFFIILEIILKSTKRAMINMMNRRYPLFILTKAIRNWFEKNQFLETITPPLVENPGMETHIHPFQVRSVYKDQNLDKYLHTSPEFYMKELLSQGFEKIYNLSYCFRDEPNSSTHRYQFLMLEWYRANEKYITIMDDVESLFIHCHDFLNREKIKTRQFDTINFQRKTVREIFKEFLDIDLYKILTVKEIKSYIINKHTDIHIPDQDLEWDDYYFLLFLNKIEPRIKDIPFILIYEFPYQLSALSTIKIDDSNVCERFEVYAYGNEICNCFNELTELDLQKDRFKKQECLKRKLYNYELPNPNVLYDSLQSGLPNSSGIALGVERLLMSLTDTDNPFFN